MASREFWKKRQQRFMSVQLWCLDQKRRSVGSEATKLKHDKALTSHRYLVIATYSAHKRRANHVTKTSNYFDHRIVRSRYLDSTGYLCADFFREKVKAAFIEGDAFHRFDRAEMKKRMAEAQGNPANHFSHFGEEANEFALLEDVFKTYGETGNGRTRTYVHDDEEAEQWGCPPGTFTDWRSFEDDTDLLFYEGLHGAVATDKGRYRSICRPKSRCCPSDESGMDPEVTSRQVEARIFD